MTFDNKLENPYLFTCRNYDSGADLYYYRARYYKPQIGRFLQSAPIDYDGLGSTRQLTNSSGSVTVSYTYDSFGNLIASSGAAANVYGFTGEQQFGEADNLVFLRARYYDSRVGRFISRDRILAPMRIEDSFIWALPLLIAKPEVLHPYIYCGNNPVNWVDPYGLGWWDSFVDWVRSWLPYAVPDPVGPLTSICEMGPDAYRIQHERRRWNDEARDVLDGERLYPNFPRF
jgi:RHS repeat-associated protein